GAVHRGGQEGGRVAGGGGGGGAGAAGAVRAGEGLVDVVMLHVGAEVARAREAQDGVHVGPVEVDQGAVLVQQIGDGANLLLEQSEGVRVGDHEHGGALVELRLQVVEIDQALRVALDRERLETPTG